MDKHAGILVVFVLLGWSLAPAAEPPLTPKQVVARDGEKVTVEFGLFKPENHFQGKTVRVTGIVTILKFGDIKGQWWAIYVNDLDQLEVLPPKYHTQVLEGFNVFVSQELVDHPAESGPALNELKAQLAEVPTRPLKAPREAPIRLERDEKKHAAYYSWGKWDKDSNSGLVVLANAKLFVDWSRNGQPYMVLHELAHAYHHRVLGEQHAGIKAAYAQAMERKLYDSVAYVHGGKKKAYATTNEREYFAELTEAYFGKNDFFPFNRAELKEYDSVGFRLMQDVWDK